MKFLYFSDLCVRRALMDHRAFESSALARKVLPMSPASLIYNDENGIHFFYYIYIY